MSAKAPGGYDYVGVTRFGHRAEYIFPENFGAFRLNFIGGFWTYAAYVKGYKPEFDWAEEALETTRAIARDRGHNLSQRLSIKIR